MPVLFAYCLLCLSIILPSFHFSTTDYQSQITDCWLCFQPPCFQLSRRRIQAGKPVLQVHLPTSYCTSFLNTSKGGLLITLLLLVRPMMTASNVMPTNR